MRGKDSRGVMRIQEGVWMCARVTREYHYWPRSATGAGAQGRFTHLPSSLLLTMTAIASKVWSSIVAWQTGRDASDGYTREKVAQHISDYNAHFDRSLTTTAGAKYDEKRDAEKIKGRVENAQEMTNQYYDLATEFYEYGTSARRRRSGDGRDACSRWTRIAARVESEQLQ
jgi:hypothetical protein